MNRLLFTLLFPIIAIAQKTPSEQDCAAAYKAIPRVDGHYEWSEVIQVDTLLKRDDLYRNAKTFFANEFKSAKDVLQYDDRGEGKVIGKGNFFIEDNQMVFMDMFSDKRTVNFTLEIYCKDGRYKYRIYAINCDFILRASGGSGPDNVTRDNISLDDAYQKCLKGMTKKMDRRLFMLMLAEINSTVADVKRAMASTKKDDF